MHPPQAQQPTPPFNALAARRLRAALGMGPEYVAYGMRTSYGLPYVTPSLVIAWERGTEVPSWPELTALAGALWCSPGELIDAPRTLREYRLSRGLAQEDVARAVGLELLAYQQMEEAAEWRGNERQSTALAEVLELSLPDFITITGRDDRLAQLLRSSVTMRWQSYVRPVMKLIPLDRRLLEDVLKEMHTAYQERLAVTPVGGGSSASGRDLLGRIVDHLEMHTAYQGQMAVTPGRGGGSSGATEDTVDPTRDFLDRIVGHFWSAVERSTH